ncbi:phosphoribosyltransferase domain-containing protein [Candidatus Avoscillospira sp. LCP25S3_F1]|uniref:phosphoribosyltransferase domain-containing protein n=1 Tax=Candidatus Avoscillospira sp. LCP25S3_F1 TaxID=3438825 RepID=UPI003F910FCD
MQQYTMEDVLRIAKRYRNTKRSYLLVNPLQAKHLPVDPETALALMEHLGESLRRSYPSARLVIGFAETATAIGAVAAAQLAGDCFYVQTTREDCPGNHNWLEFQEEHSHAVEQKLCGDALEAGLAATDTVILVDDEISTGKTILNMVEQMANRYPSLREKTVVAASILNRVTPEQEARLRQAGIVSHCLVRLPQADYDSQVARYTVEEAPQPPQWTPETPFQSWMLSGSFDQNPRLGVSIGDYVAQCRKMADAFLQWAALPEGGRTLVLGTEECMLPSLILGQQLARRPGSGAVRCHATTRSPIGVSREAGYPIVSGAQVRSFYSDDRKTYLYNLESYDAVVVVSDTMREDTAALCSVLSALPGRGTARVYYIQGGNHVWYL